MSNSTEEKNIQGIYLRLVSFALLVHLSYIAIFAMLSMTAPMMYNIFSVIFYIFMFVIAEKGFYRTIVSLIHIEVTMFAVFCTLTGAIGLDMKLFILAISSTVYFCPFKHKYVPYLFGICELIVYMLLELYCHFRMGEAPMLQGTAFIAMKIYSALLCFGTILLNAFLSGVSADVTKKKLTDENEALEKLANYDQLTGLQSRYMFLDRVNSNKGNSYITVCIADIDDFKVINDTYGHIYGDYVLQEIAQIMKGFFDPDNVDICRWGGEEILFTIYEVPFMEAYEKIEQLRQKISDYVFYHDKIRSHVTMTFGVYSGNNEENRFDLVAKADKLLYKGKRSGKNMVIKKVL